MTSISAAKARQNIYKILNDVNENSEPITITNTKGRNAMIISEDDWKAIQETIHPTVSSIFFNYPVPIFGSQIF